jgi:phospholipid/cholesterol/gamma-HCH transport system substrate-binding protein
VRKRLEVELKVGLFVTIGVTLAMVAILILGSAQSLTQSKNHYETHMATAEGLISGAKVMMSGIHVGTIDSMAFDGERRDVLLKFSVDKKSSEWVRKDSSVEVLTQGVLGDKFLSLVPGTELSPKLPDGAEVTMHAGRDLTQFLSKGDQLLVTLNTISSDLSNVIKSFEANNRSEELFAGLATSAKNLAMITEKLNHQMDDIPLKTAVKNMNSILDKINNGTGTLGELVNDPGLYDSIKALVGGANRNRIVRNLVRQAVEDGNAEQATPAAPTK